MPFGMIPSPGYGVENFDPFHSSAFGWVPQQIGGNATGQPIAPTGVTDYSAAYGGKPTVPSPVATAATAASGNLANVPALTALGASVNPAMAQQYYAGIPNYTGLNDQSSQNIGSMLRGELPQGVVNQIAQRAAERGVATGQTSPAAYLSALGLNALQLQQQGESALNQSVARNTRAPFYSAASGFVSPSDIQSAQTAANIYAAAPVPSAAQGNALRAAQQGLGQGYNAARFQNPFQNYGGSSANDTSQLLDAILSQYAPHLEDQAFNVPFTEATLPGAGQSAPSPLGPYTTPMTYNFDPTEDYYFGGFEGTLGAPGLYPGEY